MEYDRSRSFHATSLALWQYNKDLKDLNDFYWSSRFSLDISARQAKAHPGASGPQLLSALATTSAAATHVGHTPEELAQRHKTADRWVRLSALVLASSAFERYLITVVSAAVESDPLLAPGWPKLVDGLALRRHGLAVAERNLEGTVKGDWPRRVASYNELFGYLPAELVGAVSDLERLRKMRNAVAHEFGGDNKPSVMPSSALLLSIRRHVRPGSHRVSISETGLVAALRTFDKVANGIDKHLLGQHIGGYELAAIYLDWDADRDRFEGHLGVALTGSKRGREQRFTNAMGPFLPPFGTEYQRSMESHLQAL